MKNDEKLPVQEEALHDEGELHHEEIKLTGHQWRQRGPWIVCTSCPIEHAFHVGVNTLLIGIDEQGMPKFEKRLLKK